MAMQGAAMGFSKIIILFGAGYTGTLLLNNGKLSDVFGQLVNIVKGFEEKRRDGDEGDYADAVAGQVRRLAMEVRQLASASQITVLNGVSGNVTSLVVPSAALGVVGYGYMWWKGLSFSDLMYVTKQNMENAVSNLTNNLEHVSDALAAAKKHLTQRIENVDGKTDEQLEISKLLKDDVADVHHEVNKISFDMGSLHRKIDGLNGKVMTLDQKQDFANYGIWYLCNKEKGNAISDEAKEQFKVVGKSFGNYLSSRGGLLALEGIKQIADILDSGNVNELSTNGIYENRVFGSESQLRLLTRTNTIKFNV